MYIGKCNKYNNCNFEFSKDYFQIKMDIIIVYQPKLVDMQQYLKL